MIFSKVDLLFSSFLEIEGKSPNIVACEIMGTWKQSGRSGIEHEYPYSYYSALKLIKRDFNAFSALDKEDI